MKREENMKILKKIILKILFFSIFKKFIKFKQHSINIKNYTAHPHDLVHVSAKKKKHYTPPPPKPPHIWDKKSEQRNKRI